MREVEAEMKPAAPPAPPPQQPEIVTQKITMPTQPAKPRKDETTQKIRAVSQEHLAEVRQLVTQPGQIASPAHTAARKLQDAVDETPLAEEKRINLERKIEGASKTFSLHDNGFLEINFARSVHVKRGTVSSYSGNLKFLAESGLLGTTAQTLIKAYPLSISSNALVAWTGNLIPTVMDDKSVDTVMIETADEAGFKIRFEGEGVVVSEQ